MNFFEKIAAVAGVLRMSGKKIVAVKIYVMDKDAEKVFEEEKEMAEPTQAQMNQGQMGAGNLTMTTAAPFGGFQSMYNMNSFTTQGWPEQPRPYRPEASHCVVVSTDADATPAEIAGAVVATAEYKNALARREMYVASKKAAAALQQQWARNMSGDDWLKQQLGMDDIYHAEQQQIARNQATITQTTSSYQGIAQRCTQTSWAGLTKSEQDRANEISGFRERARKLIDSIRGKK